MRRVRSRRLALLFGGCLILFDSLAAFAALPPAFRRPPQERVRVADPAPNIEEARRGGGGRGGARAAPRGASARGAYRGPRGGAVARGPHGGAVARGPYGGAVARGPRGGVAARPPGARPPVARPPVAGRPGVRPPGGAWVRPPSYWWRPGGAIAAGAAIGFVGAAAATAYARTPAPGPGYCWYYTDGSRRQGFWDQCP